MSKTIFKDLYTSMKQAEAMAKGEVSRDVNTIIRWPLSKRELLCMEKLTPVKYDGLDAHLYHNQAEKQLAVIWDKKVCNKHECVALLNYGAILWTDEAYDFVTYHERYLGYELLDFIIEYARDHLGMVMCCDLDLNFWED